MPQTPSMPLAQRGVTPLRSAHHSTTIMQRIHSALHHINNNDRNTWLRIGMAVKSELGEEGFDLWNNWSKSADSYNAKTARTTWKSIKSEGGVTIGTLFHEAKINGWKEVHNYIPPIMVGVIQQKCEAESARDRQATAARAQVLWNTATPAAANNPYLHRKGVMAVNTLRQIEVADTAKILGYMPQSKEKALVGMLLVVPISQGEGISTLELIDGDGRKTALVGRGSKTGGYWTTMELPSNDSADLTLLIGEGVATMLSASLASGHLGIAALSNSNIPKVADALRQRYPLARITVLADLNKVTGKPDIYAIKAADAVSGTLAVPNFGKRREKWRTDFNGLHQCAGLDAVKHCLEGIHAINTPQTKESITSKPEKISFPHAGGRFEVSEHGVFFIGVDAEGENKKPQWICSKLIVAAKTRDIKGTGWGRLLQWSDDDERLHTWAIPSSLLQSDGLEFRKELANGGLTITTSRSGRDLLGAYIQSMHITEKARCVDRLGWSGNVFVRPHSMVDMGESTAKAGELVVYQNPSAIEPAFSESGTLASWRENVARLAAGNTRLVFAIALAFAGSVLELVNEESGGFHLLGGSTKGKTTAAIAAASVWGHPKQYMRSWRATANALEGLALMHNDGILILDEIKMCPPKDVAEAAYMLPNGQGKTRSDRNGMAKPAAQWRLLFLSTGELTLEELMKAEGKEIDAGQVIRLANIEAVVNDGFGAFDTLHEYEQPEMFSKAITNTALWRGRDSVANAGGMQPSSTN